jgi:hypothetical protein
LYFKASDAAAAVKSIKDQWIEQGIWDSTWDDTRLTDERWYWKHEVRPGVTGQLRPGHWMPESLHDSSSASRPSNQFVFQLKVECRRLAELLRDRSSVLSGSILHTIYSNAYTSLRNLWVSWGIWYSGWKVMPGTSWIHELPLEAWLKEEMGDDYIAHDESSAWVKYIPEDPGDPSLLKPLASLQGQFTAPAGRPSGFSDFARSPAKFGTTAAAIAFNAAKAAKSIKQLPKSATAKKAKDQPKSAAPAKKAKTVKQTKKTPATRTRVQPSGGVSKSRRSPPPPRRSGRLQGVDE